MGLVVKTSSWMLKGPSPQRAQESLNGMPNLDAAILDALHRDGGCQDQLLRGAKGVQKEHAHQALTAQGDGGPQQGVLGALGLFLALLEGQIVCGVHQSPISML